jgi:hypothetical protein
MAAALNCAVGHVVASGVCFLKRLPKFCRFTVSVPSRKPNGFGASPEPASFLRRGVTPVNQEWIQPWRPAGLSASRWGILAALFRERDANAFDYKNLIAWPACIGLRFAALRQSRRGCCNWNTARLL